MEQGTKIRTTAFSRTSILRSYSIRSCRHSFLLYFRLLFPIEANTSIHVHEGQTGTVELAVPAEGEVGLDEGVVVDWREEAG